MNLHRQSRILDEVEGMSFGDIGCSKTGSSLVNNFGWGGSDRLFAIERVFVNPVVINLQRNRLVIMVAALGVSNSMRQLSDGLYEAMVFQFLKIANVGHLCLVNNFNNYLRIIIE